MRSNLNSPATPSLPAAAQALRAFLRVRGLRMTGEREALLRAALARRRHFTLEELVRDAVRRHATASRATVYRALPILIDAGILQPVLVTSEPRRFELAFGRRHHDHLLCRRCGKVVEFRSAVIEDLQLGIAARHRFRLTGHVHELVGDCAGCRGLAPRARRQRGGAQARVRPGARRTRA
jgi:Fur family ferric uptake transcriptional regulator